MDLLKDIEGAILRAHDEYWEMSGGALLGSGAEYFVTCAIARSLATKVAPRHYCTIEEPVASFAPGRGRPRSNSRRSGKVDVAVWTNHDAPMAAIEVKSCVAPNFCDLDLARLFDITLFGNRRPSGYLAYFYPFEATNAESLRTVMHRRAQFMQEKCEAEAWTNKLTCVTTSGFTSDPFKEDDWHYGGLAFVAGFAAH